MPNIKLLLSDDNYERLQAIAAARKPDEVSLPSLLTEALNAHLKLDPPIPPPRKRGNPTGNKGKPIKQPKRKGKAED